MNPSFVLFFRVETVAPGSHIFNITKYKMSSVPIKLLENKAGRDTRKLIVVMSRRRRHDVQYPVCKKQGTEKNFDEWILPDIGKFSLSNFWFIKSYNIMRNMRKINIWLVDLWIAKCIGKIYGWWTRFLFFLCLAIILFIKKWWSCKKISVVSLICIHGCSVGISWRPCCHLTDLKKTVTASQFFFQLKNYFLIQTINFFNKTKIFQKI